MTVQMDRALEEIAALQAKIVRMDQRHAELARMYTDLKNANEGLRDEIERLKLREQALRGTG